MSRGGRPLALLAWELGSGRGHAVRLLAIREALVASGWDVAIAASRLDLFAAARRADPGLALHQAPIWPGQLAAGRPRRAATAVTFGDVLAEAGLDDAEAVAAVLCAWTGLLDLLRPDAVAADFAPGALLAARGRVRTIAVGTGFTVPPTEGARFPPLRDGHARSAFREADLLGAIRAGCAAAGAPAPERLPAAVAADLPLPAAFPELDPYGRATLPCGPTVPALPDRRGGGDEVFVYLNELVDPRPWLVPAARGCPAPVRAHMPGLPPVVGRELAAAGIRVEAEPLPFAAIAERSRLVVSHAPAGVASAALCAGLPQLLVPFDLEKGCNAAALLRLGCARVVPLRALRGTAPDGLLAEALADAGLAAAAAEAGPRFAARRAPTLAARVAAELRTT